MRIAVLANDVLREEMMAQGLADDTDVEWLTEIPVSSAADTCIDLLFNDSEERIDELKKTGCPLIIVNSLTLTLDQLPQHFIRINAWPTFLKRTIVEAACHHDTNKEKAEKIFAGFNKTVEWVPDIPGFITARVISMIINEAYFALEDEVCSKEETDIAMKLGTHYPLGPFEWSKKIGINNVYALLNKLSADNKRYEPCALLKQEALQQ